MGRTPAAQRTQCIDTDQKYTMLRTLDDYCHYARVFRLCWPSTVASAVHTNVFVHPELRIEAR